MVLVTCVVPAKAAVMPIDIWQFHSNTTTVDTDVVYEFDLSPLGTWFQVTGSDGSYAEGRGGFSYDIPDSATFVNIYAWPTGTRNWYNANAERGLLSLEDFKDFHVFTVSGNYQIELDVISTVDEQTGQGQYAVDHYLQVQYYDVDGVYLGKAQNSQTRDIFNVKTGNGVFLDWNLQDTVMLKPPDNAVYFTFQSFAKLVSTSINMDSYIDVIWPDSDDYFRIFCSVNATAQELINDIDSKKLQEDMKNQLQDLNDKATVIIDGSQDMHDAVSDADDVLTDVGGQFGDLKAQEDVIYDDWHGSQSGLISEIKRLIYSNGWDDLKYLLGALFVDVWKGNIIESLMIVTVAIFNLSIILFGR